MIRGFRDLASRVSAAAAGASRVLRRRMPQGPLPLKGAGRGSQHSLSRVCGRHSEHFALALVIAVAPLSPAPALAAYPEKPVTIVVPFAAGGANDVVVRVIAQPFSEVLGQPVIVENRGGAGGSVGAAFVARARPDGYTLLMAATGFVVNPSLYEKVQYDPLKDFDQVAELTSFPVIYTVLPDLGVSTLPELIAYARARPGALNYSTPGAGTLPHLAAELLKLLTNISMVHVPYPGAAPAAQALLSKTVEVASTSITVAKPQIEAGRMKGLAVTGSERWPELPDVPTVAEAGVPAALADTWQGIMVPAGTPREIIERLHGAMVKALKQPDVAKRLAAEGAEVIGSTPEEFAAHIKSELARVGDVVRAAGIRAE